MGGASTTAYYHSDANGNVTALVDANQQVVARYLYDPFGGLLASSGPLAEANLYRFSSKEFHLASGLVYYLYRYYEPQLQRWMNRDPLGEGGFALLQHGKRKRFGSTGSLFSYVANSPLQRFDAFGLEGVDDLIKCLEAEKDQILNRIYELFKQFPQSDAEEREVERLLKRQDEIERQIDKLRKPPFWITTGRRCVRGLQVVGGGCLNILGWLGGLWILPGQDPTGGGYPIVPGDA